MDVKSYKGNVYGLQLFSKEREALDLEIRSKAASIEKEMESDIDAMVLYTLHKYLGFGPARLRKFWESLSTAHDDLIKYYEMEDFPWLCKHELKKIGVDVERWPK